MLLDTVMIVSREVFEAASIICILMVLAYHYKLSKYWLLLGLLTGLAGASLFATNLGSISAVLDYRGQELLVASIYITLYSLILLLSAFCSRHSTNNYLTSHDHRIFATLFVLLISLSLIREFGEIIVYLLTHHANVQTGLPSLLFGLLLGCGIGGSVATILFFMLIRIPRAWGITVVKYWLAIQSGVLLMKASLLMSQINFLPHSPALWDTSNWLPEQSISGHLLAALIGYDSHPSLIQIGFFAFGCLSVVLVYVILRDRTSKNTK